MALAAMRLCILSILLPVALGISLLKRQSSVNVRGEDTTNPVTKVVKLLEEMKSTAEAEAKEDEEIYGKMACWCKTNDKEKTEAIEIAEKRIESLTAAIESGTAHAAELATAIDGLKDDIAEDQDAIEKAVAIREKEKEEFEAEDADLSESSALLKEALAVLSKVQLMQKKDAPAPQANPPASEDAFVQVRKLVSRATVKAPRAGAYFGVMQKDLWDLLSTMPGSTATSPRVVTGLSQEQEEAPTGAAAGSKSYNSRSGSIFGLLEQMKETMDKNLAAAHKAEIDAEISFQKLRGTKEAELEAAAKSLEEKSVELADTKQKVAQAKEDLEDTKEALSADTKFLMDLKERCAKADEDYAARSKTRQEEITAIAEAIDILMADESRDLISKTISFVQTGSRARRNGNALAMLSSEMAPSRQHAASQLLQVAKKHSGTEGGWKMALLAVSAQIDGFDKVKGLMDKMIAELKKQQGEEYEKHEACKKDIDTNEDATMVKKSEEKDTNALITSLTGELEALTKELEELAVQVSEAHVALKAAGETRKKENHEFQQTVADQRATIEILNKALDRLKAFYAKSASLLATGKKQQMKQPEPGAAAPPPPPAGKAYEKNGMAGGVLQMLEKVIQEAEIADQEAVAGEQASQSAYATFVANTNEMLDSYEKAIAAKTAAKEDKTASKLTAGQDLAAIEQALTDLGEENKALHTSCDYLLKNYDIRQTARQEEIEAIQEAKAILSGADFGF